MNQRARCFPGNILGSFPEYLGEVSYSFVFNALDVGEAKIYRSDKEGNDHDQ